MVYRIFSVKRCIHVGNTQRRIKRRILILTTPYNQQGVPWMIDIGILQGRKTLLRWIFKKANPSRSRKLDRDRVSVWNHMITSTNHYCSLFTSIAVQAECFTWQKRWKYKNGGRKGRNKEPFIRLQQVMDSLFHPILGLRKLGCFRCKLKTFLKRTACVGVLPRNHRNHHLAPLQEQLLLSPSLHPRNGLLVSRSELPLDWT